MFSKQKALRFSRKLLASALALVMVLVALPVVSFAADYTATNYAAQQGKLVSASGFSYLRDDRAGVLWTTYQAAEGDVNKNTAAVNGTLTYTYVKMSANDTATVQFYLSTDKWNSTHYGRLNSITSTGGPATSWQLSPASTDNGSNPTGGFDIDTEFYQWIGTITLASPAAGTYNATFDYNIKTANNLFGISSSTNYGNTTISIVVLDKSALAKAVDEATALLASDSAYLTDDSVSALESALETAEPMAVVDYETDQNSINNATDAVQNAINTATYKPADKSRLKDAIDTYAATYADGGATYTDASWAPFAEAYEAAAALNSNDSLNIKNQGEIDAAATQLSDTFANLVQDASFYSLEELQALTSEMQALYDQNSQYMTEECATALETALANANTAAEAAEAGDDSLIDDAYTALEAIVVTYAPADYSALNDALADAQAFLADSDNAANYDDNKVAALRDAVAEATQIAEGLDKRSQAMIDEVTDALTANLPTEDDLKDANYSELDALLAQAEEFLADTDSLQYYDADEVAALQAAYNDAKAIERGQTILYQSTINAAVEQLTLTMLDESDMTRANTTALSEALAAANEWLDSANLANYSEEAVAALTTAVEAGQTLLDSNPAVIYQDDVNAAAQAITDAMLDDSDLKDANYDTFNALLEQAQAVLADETTYVNYNAEAIAALQAAVDAAAAVEAGQKITYQPTIDAMTETVKDAMPTDADLLRANMTELQAAVDAANAKLNEEGHEDFTIDSVNALKAQIILANGMLTNVPSILEQEKVDAQTDAVIAATEAVQLERADDTALIQAVAEAEAAYSEMLASGNYEETALDAYAQAIAAAKQVIADQPYSIREQDMVAAEVAKLTAAAPTADDLKPANVDDLNAAIAEGKAKMQEAGYSDYTAYTREVLENAVDAAEALAASDPTILQQADVNAAAQAVRSAIAGLIDAEADYSKLNSIVATAELVLKQANLEDTYTKASIAALQAAVDAANALDKHLPGDQQSVVDAAADAVRNAYQNMQTYNKVTNVTVSLASSNNGKDEVDGNVIYHTTPWYQTWMSQSVTLKYDAGNADVASVQWVAANWSVDKPEATITNNADGTVTITPTFGIGPRSMWVKAIVTDVNGNVIESDPIKVRFINWSWQK